MEIQLYRSYKIVPNDRPHFREADILSNSHLVGYVWQGVLGNRTDDDLLAECCAVIDDYILWKEAHVR